MKKWILLTMLTLMTAVLFACGSNESNDTDEESTSSDNSETSLYEQIQEKGVLTVGTEGTYPPFTFHNDDDELTGYDVEVAREIGKRLDLEVKFNETKWDSMFAGLNSERFDMIANQVGIRPDREEKYDFSEPYTISTAVLVAKKGNENINTFEDINGEPVAQSLTSNYADIAKEYGGEIQSVEGFNEAMQLIGSGRVQATINERLSVLDYINQKGDQAPVEIVDSQEDAAESAMMFRKGNEDLVEAVNGALNEMKEDGTLAEISNKWFGEDVSTQ
ncbi:amino acid ABC transporter substrate-binding protein [Thalassobacillus devorans]|uniref:Amino acid ABC transporter substrate-binding protein n=1 Tax=Thalassobacillus devorans TaxID=279813 RepID=A0ABQ1NJP8_9BACI|nr:amino acid ABC transporter substrate-binding protein [Thalassobacillus devorans]NIK27329.1 cystine transport system substrate-binding protein [Thalassobacillus devorans]GGC76841.1 amino acid ABC transporter substrate-binding protein [Thalassobacillus devorans]